ncbi:MAG TPA: zinc-dependent dehydrogenase [Candidatus Limnocylindrales bacterium]
MIAACLHAPGDLRLESVPDPEPGDGDLVLRVLACGTCGTDVKVFRFGHQHISLPRVMGHEIAGEIVAVGAGVTDWDVGDRVQIIAAIPDLTCFQCQRGFQTVCEDLESMGYQYDGGFAEYIRVPAKVLAAGGVNRIPDGLEAAEAAVTEPLACVLNGQELARVGDGDTVAVVGAGPIGCLHVRLARARGAAKVFLVDVNPSRLALAARLGADALVDGSAVDPVSAIRDLTDGRGADVVITAAASKPAQEQALSMAIARGRVSLFGGLPKDDSIIASDSNLIHYRELSVVGAYGSAPRHNREALELIAGGRVSVRDLITDRLPLDRVQEALDIVASGKGIKVVVEPAASVGPA